MARKSEKARLRKIEAEMLGITVEELKALRLDEQRAKLERNAAAKGLSVPTYLAGRRNQRRARTVVARSSPRASVRTNNGTATAAKPSPRSGAIPLGSAGAVLKASVAKKPRKAVASVKSGKSKPTGSATMTCRECLRRQPRTDFPNPRRRRCENLRWQAGE